MEKRPFGRFSPVTEGEGPGNAVSAALPWTLGRALRHGCTGESESDAHRNYVKRMRGNVDRNYFRKALDKTGALLYNSYR